MLLAHLVLFGYIYPDEAGRVPSGLMRGLLAGVTEELEKPPGASRLCRGTVLSRAQYLVDVEAWGYRDARLEPLGNLSAREIEIWTQAIGESTPDPISRPAAFVADDGEGSAGTSTR